MKGDGGAGGGVDGAPLPAQVSKMKKDNNRYTIRFNPADPRHQRAMDVLESAGRRKASLIADAVCEYLARHGGAEPVAILAYESRQLAVPDIEVSSEQKTPYLATEHHNDNDTNTDEIGADTLNDASFDEMCQAVLGGLSMFEV